MSWFDESADFTILRAAHLAIKEAHNENARSPDEVLYTSGNYSINNISILDLLHGI